MSGDTGGTVDPVNRETVPIVGKGHAAYHCHECDDDAPTWTINRRGDAVVSWACFLHLPDVCMALQRDFETTELVVTWRTRTPRWLSWR